MLGTGRPQSTDVSIKRALRNTTDVSTATLDTVFRNPKFLHKQTHIEDRRSIFSDVPVHSRVTARDRQPMKSGLICLYPLFSKDKSEIDYDRKITIWVFSALFGTEFGETQE